METSLEEVKTDSEAVKYYRYEIAVKITKSSDIEIFVRFFCHVRIRRLQYLTEKLEEICSSCANAFQDIHSVRTEVHWT